MKQNVSPGGGGVGTETPQTGVRGDAGSSILMFINASKIKTPCMRAATGSPDDRKPGVLPKPWAGLLGFSPPSSLRDDVSLKKRKNQMFHKSEGKKRC